MKVAGERSQHANKRLAYALLMHKLEAENAKQLSHHEQQRWQQHWELEHGNPVKTFKGNKFVCS
ncbi:hypothetical protein L4C34_14965 [Vibrio profundum]|uniref:hypothetical protein n=1 Tax=Vibrio profundum TaxID=2910247 RepID=UPI003D0EA773